MSTRALSSTAREELADARLILDNASHNLQLLLRGKVEHAVDFDQALENAHLQLSQVLSTLARLMANRAGR
jgi:hypothetical protein